MGDDKLDHDALVTKSLECRRRANKAATLDEYNRWIQMADEFLKLAQELEH